MKQRTLTALALLGVVIGVLFFDPSGRLADGFGIAIILFGSFEFCRILKLKEWAFPVVGFALLVLKVLTPPFFLSYSPLIALFGGVLCYLGVSKGTKPIAAVGGFAWLASTLIPLVAFLHQKQPDYWPLFLTLAIPIWSGDTAAIFAGKAFGKHKLAPTISPKKTWEGAIANFLACIVAAVVLSVTLHYSMPLMLLLGVSAGILGQAGDLFESYLKRQADMKDSGTILPGHGGVLDRIDSLMALAPVAWVILSNLPGKR